MRFVAAGLVILFVSLFPSLIFAQTGRIEGMVTDQNGRELAGANVYIDSTNQGTATDAAGRFVIDRVQPGSYTLVISIIGFQKVQRSISVSAEKVETIRIQLQEITFQSAEVVVTATRREQLALTAPVSVSVLGLDEITSRNIYVLDDALRYMPGVQMAGNQVNIRGSSGFSYNVGSRVLLLVDGVPLLGPESGGIPFESLPLSQLDRIEVVKGPGSALYGAGALGGIINVITRDFPERPSTMVQVFGGAHDPVRFRQWRTGWEGGSDYRLLGGTTLAHARRLSDRLGFWTNVSYRTDTGYMAFNEKTDFQGYSKVGWNPRPTLRFELYGGYTWREYDSFYYWNGADDPLSPGSLDLLGPGSKGANDLQSSLLSVLPTMTHIVRPDLVYSIKARYFRVHFVPLDDLGKPRENSKHTVGYRVGSEVQVNWNPEARRNLTMGITGDASAARSEFFSGAGGGLTRGQPEGAAFVQWDEKVTDRLNVIGGLRFDVYQIDERNATSKLSPKLNLAYTPNELTSFRFSYGQGFRVPSVAERFTNNQDFFPVLPNLGLLPEKSTGYEIGVRRLLSIGNRWGGQWDLALFWNDYWDLVEPRFVVRSAETGFQFVNLTRARIRGLETTFESSTLDGKYSARIGYTLLDPRDLSEDKPLIYRSRHAFTGSVSASPLHWLNLGADLRVSSKPLRVDSDFSRFVPDADLIVPVKVVDLRVGYRSSRYSASILLKNALDYYYVERPALLAPPRQVQLLLQVNL